MKPARSRTILAAGAVVLLVALVTAGCGRRAQPADAGAAPTATSATAPAVAGAPSAPPVADASVSPAPTGTPAAVRTTATPVSTPDLAGIETLITEIGQDLGADASAGTSEGSPK